MKLGFIDGLKFDGSGLIPVVTQDVNTKEVLMLAYMNAEAVKKTIETGKVHYYSRSRGALWLKGETSGNYQYTRDIFYDCDADALLVLADPKGPACHTGNISCFYRNYEEKPKHYESGDILKHLYSVITNRKENPLEGSYTNYLFEKGLDKMLKKVGEESAEVIIAAKNGNKDELIYEISDLMYHVSVVMSNAGICWDDIYGELKKREKK